MTSTDMSAANRISQPCSGCILMAGLFLLYVVTLGHFLAQVTFVDGLTIQINQPAPMAASLYMAPQTYDRDKDQRFQRRNQYILIPKLKPACDWTSQQGFGRGPHGQHHNHNRHKVGRPVSSVSRPVSTVPQSPAHNGNQLMNPTTTPRRPLSNVANGEHVAALQLSDFAGSWKIKKPQTANNNKDWPTNQLVTYNEDGTRVLPESLYNMHSVRPFPTRNPDEYFHNVTSDDAIGSDKPQLAANQSGVAQPNLVGASTTSTTSQLVKVNQVRAEGSTIATAVSTSTTVAGLRDAFYAVTVATVSSTSFDASSTRRSPTIIDKLGGGAKRILAQIIGGILNGRQSQKNLELVKGKLDTLVDAAIDQQTADSAGLSAPISYHSGQVDEIVPAAAADVITSPEDQVRSSGDHPLKATATDAPWPIDENLHANGSQRYSTNGGWRPVIPWPPAWLKAEQQQKNGTVSDGGSRPAAPPATLVHFWSSSRSWSDVSIADQQTSLPKWPPSLGGEFKASHESYSGTTTLAPICVTTSLSSDPAEPALDPDPDPDQDTEIEANLNGTETPTSNMDVMNSSNDFKNGNNDVRYSNNDLINSDILENNGTLNSTDIQTEAEIDTIIGEQVVDVANMTMMTNDQSDGSPRMSNSSWEETFDPSVKHENEGGQRRSCIGVSDTIRALVKVFQKLPLGIPKPLDILVSYGRHHLIGKSSTDSSTTAVRSV